LTFDVSRFTKMNSEQKVQECDARDDDRRNVAGDKKIYYKHSESLFYSR